MSRPVPHTCLLFVAAALACRPGSALSETGEAWPEPVELAPAVESPSAPTQPTLGLTQPAPVQQEGLVYELYVRSFQDSDGDGTGDFNGVTSRLDYLEALGVGTLWLLPVFPAFGPTGYDVTDFTRVRAEYGSKADLDALVDAAHTHGMRVILDLPLNHVHTSHPWFADIGAHPERFVLSRSPADAIRWFPVEGAPGLYYYGYFGAEMPDLDWEDGATRSDLLETFRGWLSSGADGFRLDAVLMLVEEEGVVEGSAGSHALVADLRHELDVDATHKFLLAEASEWDPGRTASWLGEPGAPEADVVLDFPRREALVAPDAAALVDVLAAEGTDTTAMAGFLGSHDTDRLATTVTDEAERRAMRVAQLLLPGVPVLYYGDELDMANATTGTGQDLAMRAPMAWDGSNEGGFTTGHAWFPADPAFATVNVSEEAADPGSMLSLVVALTALRDGAGPAFSEPHVVDSTVLVFTRGAGVHALTVEVNLGPSEAPTALLAPWGYRVRDSTGVLLAS